MARPPDIRPRSAWLVGPEPDAPPPSLGRVELAIVHHTALGAGRHPDEVPALLREIRDLHVRGRGWDDVGYNLLVDRFGGVWEGRAGGVERAVVGAHARGLNARSCGIALLGDWRREAVPEPAAAALAALLRWKLGLHGLPVVPATVRGHGELAPTACPGGALLERLRAIRSEVRRPPFPISGGCG